MRCLYKKCFTNNTLLTSHRKFENQTFFAFYTFVKVFATSIQIYTENLIFSVRFKFSFRKNLNDISFFSSAY